uniref:Uncharacterized protein n=1 Tax=Nelumbo nucifera TaxID=4432 RepID=A0A822Y2G6_NELNU|nr:TPA_asm: hypothetical protein HUJ06_028105 [Nelumbo nucifera]
MQKGYGLQATPDKTLVAGTSIRKWPFNKHNIKEGLLLGLMVDMWEKKSNLTQ